MVIRSRAQARGSVVDRGLVGRAILLRSLGWTAAGVALWVVAMIVVSFHAVGVIR
jgi:type IV secretory pathway TrbD component